MERSTVWTKEFPLAHVLSQSERDSRCDYCFKDKYERKDEQKDELPRCSSCKVVRFCDRNCQSSAWPIHKKECQCLKKVAPKVPTESVRLILRLILKLKKDIPPVTVFGKERSWSDLMPHIDEMKNDNGRLEQFMELIVTLKTLCDDVVDLPDVEGIFVLFAKMCINSISILNDDLQPIGVGIYLKCSALDHSCRPNASAVFDGPNLIITCIESVNREDNLRINYIPSLKTRESRRKELLQQYYFHCHCEMCTDPQWDTKMMSFICSSDGCQGHLTSDEDDSFVCDVCGRVEVSDIYAQRCLTAAEKARKCVESLQSKINQRDVENNFIFGKKCLESVQNMLHQDNVNMVLLNDLLMDAAACESRFEVALKYGEPTLRGLRLYFPPHFPVIGMMLYKIGKLSSFLHRPDAGDYLQKANEILTITHGANHNVCKGLAELSLMTMYENAIAKIHK